MQKNDFTPEGQLEKESESKQKGFGKYLYYGRQPYPKGSVTGKEFPTFSADEIDALKSQVKGNDETAKAFKKRLDTLPKHTKESQQTKKLLKGETVKDFADRIKNYFDGDPAFNRYSDEGIETNKGHLNALKKDDLLGKTVEKYQPLDVVDERTGRTRKEFVDDYIRRVNNEIRKKRPKGQHVLREDELNKYLDRVYRPRSITRGDIKYPYYADPTGKEYLINLKKNVKEYIKNIQESKNVNNLYDPSKELLKTRKILIDQGAYSLDPEFARIDQEYKKQKKVVTTRGETTQRQKEMRAKKAQVKPTLDLAAQTSYAERTRALDNLHRNDLKTYDFSTHGRDVYVNTIMGASSQPTRAMETGQLKLADELRARAKDAERKFRFQQTQTKPQTATVRGAYGSVGGGYFDRIGAGSMIGRRQK